jgi:phosphate:Na+ symporter
MLPTQILFQLVGTVVLLIWGVRMVRTGVTRVLGAELRRFMALSSRNRLSAFASGLTVTSLLQSSTATTLMVGSFAGRRLIALPAALAMVLGADVGSTLVAQAFAFDIKWVWSPLLTAGVILFMSREGERSRGLARAMIGLALMLLALQELGQTAAVLKDSSAVRVILGGFGSDWFIAVLAAAVLTWAAHSSVAIVLFVMSLAGAGVVSLPLAVAMVLGANIGGALGPWVMLSGAPPAARRVPLGNLLLRGSLALAALPFAAIFAGMIGHVSADPGLAVVLFHMVFNSAAALIGLPLVPALASLLETITPDAPREADPGQPRHLDASVLDTPSEALACALRETLRLGDHVALMLHSSLTAIEGDDLRLVKEVERADSVVDRLHEAIKLYLVKASKAQMSDDESRRFVEILTFTTNLEHIGDIIDKNLMDLAGKKIRKQLSFSPEGLDELRAFHGRVAETMRLAFNVFATRDVSLARRLYAEKALTRLFERDSGRQPLRAPQGRPAGIARDQRHPSRHPARSQAHSRPSHRRRLSDPRSGRRARGHAAQGALGACAGRHRAGRGSEPGPVARLSLPARGGRTRTRQRSSRVGWRRDASLLQIASATLLCARDQRR